MGRTQGGAICGSTLHATSRSEGAEAVSPRYLRQGGSTTSLRPRSARCAGTGRPHRFQEAAPSRTHHPASVCRAPPIHTRRLTPLFDGQPSSHRAVRLSATAIIAVMPADVDSHRTPGPNFLVAGRYRLVSRIGGGGMGRSGSPATNSSTVRWPSSRSSPPRDCRRTPRKPFGSARCARAGSRPD